VWRLAVQVEPPSNRPQRELWSKTRELAFGDVSGSVGWCVAELGLHQNIVGWRLATPSVLPGGLDLGFALRRTRVIRKAVSGVRLDYDGGFYATLDEFLEVMSCYEPFTSCSLYWGLNK